VRAAAERLKLAVIIELLEGPADAVLISPSVHDEGSIAAAHASPPNRLGVPPSTLHTTYLADLPMEKTGASSTGQTVSFRPPPQILHDIYHPGYLSIPTSAFGVLAPRGAGLELPR
jgi:hypothetical protein